MICRCLIRSCFIICICILSVVGLCYLLCFYSFFMLFFVLVFVVFFFFSSRRRHTRCALVTGVQTCALPIFSDAVSRRSFDTRVTHVSALARVAWETKPFRGLARALLSFRRIGAKGGWMIGLSEMAAAANPALARWLTGAGLPCRPMGGEGGSVARPNIFDISEAAAARAGDLLIEFVDGAPSLILGGAAAPARLRFGFAGLAAREH